MTDLGSYNFSKNESYKGLFMLRLTLPPSSTPDEKKSQSGGSLHDLPLNLTSSIKLLSDIIALSKFFLKKSALQKNTSAEDTADALISEILSLDIPRETSKDKRYILSASYVAMAKADLFSNIALTKKDKESLLKFGFINPLKQGEHIASYFKCEKIFQYIDQFINIKYQEKIKQIINRACALSMIGFASYNLLISRRTFDKNQPSIATPFDPQNIIAIEKNNIIKLIEEISTLKPSTTHSGDITRYQKEIAADIDQIRNTFESIELELIKIELKQKQELLNKLIPVFLKTKPPMMDLEPEIKNFEIIAMVRNTKSHEQLLKEIDELETKQAYILAKIVSQKEDLETRATHAEKQIQDFNGKYDTDINKMKNLQLELESANATTEILRQELKNIKTKTPWWHYGLAFLGFAVGATLCASGIGLLSTALILGICTITLGLIITLSDASYMSYKIYQHCKNTPLNPPASPAPVMRITTHLTQTIPLPYPLESKPDLTTTQTEDHTPISTKPLFSPKSHRTTDKEPDKQQTNRKTP
jgi:hypothetical protein